MQPPGSLRSIPAALWIGTDLWPADAPERGHWELVGVRAIDVGGTFADTKYIFGAKILVPPANPAAKLLASSIGTDYTGVGGARPTPPEALVALQARLSEIGLRLDPVRGREFAEGYMPLDARSAWSFAGAGRLELYVDPCAGYHSERIAPAYAGFAAWEDVEEYLVEDWVRTVGRASLPERWLGILCGA
jgi:hypothetical protein